MDVKTTPSSDDGAITYVETTNPVDRQHKHDGAHDHIHGWGADADPADRPAVPMERTPPRLEHLPAELERQVPRHKIHHSTERPGITPVFGTSAPPTGASGAMRDVAFRYSENDLRHWLILLGADRVNMLEGLLSDLAHGHVPNLWKEMGLGAEWRYNRKGFIAKAVALSAIAGTVVYLMRRRRGRRGLDG